MTAEFTRKTKLVVDVRASGACEAEVPVWCDYSQRGYVARCNREPQEFHHRRNRASGGTRDPEASAASNALAVCSPCHRWITESPNHAVAHGWSVHQYHRPVACPVRVRGTWCLLSDHGWKTPLVQRGDGSWLFDATAGHDYPEWLLDGAVPVDARVVDVTASVDLNKIRSVA